VDAKRNDTTAVRNGSEVRGDMSAARGGETAKSGDKINEREIYDFSFRALSTVYFDNSFRLPRVGKLWLSRNIKDAYSNVITNVKLKTDAGIDKIMNEIRNNSTLCDGRDISIDFFSSKNYGGDYADPYFERANERFTPFSRGICFTANIKDIDTSKKCKVPVSISRSVDIDELIEVYKKAFFHKDSTYANEQGDYRAVFYKSVHENAGGFFVHHYIVRANEKGTNPKNGKKWRAGEIVGMCTILTDNKLGYILHIAVAPKFSGQSLASELIAFLAQKMETWNVETLVLDTEKGETVDGVYRPSVLEQMYTHLGFTPRFEIFGVKI
jgi:ribosomal protein S18 acetylase RimI-like enzyme